MARTKSVKLGAWIWMLLGSVECVWGLVLATAGLAGAFSMMFGGVSTWIGLLYAGGGATYLLQAAAKQVLVVSNMAPPRSQPTLAAKILILVTMTGGAAWSILNLVQSTGTSYLLVAGILVSILTGANVFSWKPLSVEEARLIRDDRPPVKALWIGLSVIECLFGLVLTLTSVGAAMAGLFGGAQLWVAALYVLGGSCFLVQAIAKGFWRGEMPEPRLRIALIACVIAGIGWSVVLGVTFGPAAMFVIGLGILVALLTTNHFFNPEGFEW